MQHLYFTVVVGSVACALGGSWLYFRRYQLSRVPVGVMNLTDIAVMMVAIIALPFLYLILPVWLVAAFLLLSALSVLYASLQPILHARWAVWLVTLSLLLSDSVTVFLVGTKQNTFFAINNVILILLAVGIANLWAQSGVKARDLVALGLLLALYDFVATAQSPLMTSLLDRLSNLPLAPIFAWNSDGATLTLGLGDVLLASVFPLAMRKAYGRTAGLIALVLALAAIGALLAFPSRQGFPVIVILAPLMAAQFLYWSRRRGQERTTRQYLLEEPMRGPDKQCTTLDTRLRAGRLEAQVASEGATYADHRDFS